jgi:hypothetical protein
MVLYSDMIADAVLELTNGIALIIISPIFSGTI